MNNVEKKILSLLRHMREEYGLIGVKGEFEAEGARFEELLRLKDIASAADLELIVKIGGCEAITDMRHARSAGASHIVAPMIESAFAATKFIGASKAVFRKEELEKVGLLINVETVDGIRNFDQICDIPEAEILAGLDIGRVDMACSMGLGAESCNSNQVFQACLEMCGKWHEKFPEKSCTIGGLLNMETIRFLEAMPREYHVGCESKKAVFSSEVIERGKLKEAFLEAIRFETLWYENYMEDYHWMSSSNWNYFKILPKYEMVLRG